MALQDLTPQLRTRLHRVEKIVSLFVGLAFFLLIAGFGYYLYDTGIRKGWFIPKCNYFTLLMSAEGLKVGDPVVLMGFNVGKITFIEAEAPDAFYKVFVGFDVRRPYYGYIWSDSKIRINSSLLGGRHLEVLAGFDGKPTVYESGGAIEKVLVKGQVVPVGEAPKGVYVASLEDPALTERAQKLINQIEVAIPGVLGMTNQVNGILTNVCTATANLNKLLLDVHPILTNAEVITANLRNPNGSLGNWLIPTNLNVRLDATIDSANATVTNLNTRLTTLTTTLNQTLTHVATITSNLNAQVQANDNLVGNVNDLLLETEDLMRGLKRHWLLKSAFPNPPKIESPQLLLEPQLERGQP